MTLDEKLAQMHGTSIIADGGLWRSEDLDRLGVPGFAMSDGPRGLTATTSTTFPVAMARGASFDPDLERAVAEVIGAEAHAYGANVLLAPCVNLLNHPAWGRAQETYGEDPALLARMGVAFVSGAQTHIAASVKHLALNNIELSRFDVDVTATPRLLHEVYLPAFEATVREAGGKRRRRLLLENAPLLTDILRGMWGFQGRGVRLDLGHPRHGGRGERRAWVPMPNIYGDALRDAIGAGDVTEATVDDAVRRILRTKAAFSMQDPAPRDPAIIGSDAHGEVALRAARESLVLLQNEDVGGAPALPLGDSVARVAVFGALADTENLGDTGSSASYPSDTVTPLEGVEALAATRGVAVDAVTTDTPDAAGLALAADADVAVVVVGLTAEDEGEYIPVFPGGADREELGLSPTQVALIESVAGAQPRTVVLVEGGSAVVMDPWIEQVPAAMMIWYPGQAGGTAVAEALFGELNPSGKLPLSIPTSAAQLPPFDNESVEVTYGDLHGYWHLDATGSAPRFAFGHGESYTDFTMNDVGAPAATATDSETLQVSVDVVNFGDRDGVEVVQLYAGPTTPDPSRPLRRLVGFERIELAAGESRRVEIPADLTMLRRWDPAAGALVLEPGEYTVWVGHASDDLPLQTQLTVE